MRLSPEQVESRREFFRAAARYGLLAGITVAAGLLGRNRLPGKPRCVRRSLCRQCAVFAECELPQALMARQAQSRSQGH